MEQVAIVTGGSRGIGLATCKSLYESGFKVLLCSTNASQAKAAALEVGQGVLGMGADVSNPSECQKLFSEANEKLGPVTLLVNNAGRGLSKRLADSSNAEIDSVVDVNLKGVLYCCRQASIEMNEGAIINISSFFGVKPAANASVYCATKFGVMGLSGALAAELYPKIKVFTVCPGVVDTKLLRDSGFKGRADSPQKIAGIVADLAVNWRERETGLVVEAWKSK